MGNPRRANKPTTRQLASKDDQLLSQDATQLLLLELVLSSVCGAVETHASHRQEELEPSLAEDDDALVRIYKENMWKQPLERALKVVNDWSLAKFQTQKPLFQREIAYPADAKPAPAVVGQQIQEEAKDDDEPPLPDTQQPQQQKSSKKQHQHKRQRATDPITTTTAAKRDTPELFRTGARIDEDPLEVRWDHRGDPVPLRRNILGEHYAPLSDPLRFVKQNKERSPAEIYQQMKHAVRETLRDREKRRIQAQGFLSPEAALEAKFDRMFVENNEPQESSNDGAASLGKGEKAADTGSNSRDDDEEQEDEEGDDTDEASDSESNQQQQQKVLVK